MFVPKMLFVITGLHYRNNFFDRQIYNIVKKITPFNEKNIFKDDIALLKLDRKIKFDAYTKIIDISETDSENLLNKCLVTAGWGSTSSTFSHDLANELQEKNLKIINEKTKCYINKIWEKNHVFCTESAYFLSKSLPCFGDSGKAFEKFENSNFY